MFRPPRAAAAAAEKKIKRDIEEILLPSDVKENYHRSDLAVRMATKKGRDIPSLRTTTTTLKTDDDTMTQQHPRTKKAKTSTSTTAPTMSDKTPPPPPFSLNYYTNKTVIMEDYLADAVENGPIMGRSTTLLVNKSLEFSQMFSPLYPQAIDFAKKRIRRHG